MAKEKQRVPVSERALVQRINRVLAKDYEVLRRPRGRSRGELGRYYRLSTFHNVVKDKSVNLEALGRELGCLQEWERLEVGD